MTPLLVLFYLIYTLLNAIIWSLHIAFCRLSECFLWHSSKEKGNLVALYEGTVYHDRRHPARNSFRFPARYELIDLDRPPFSPRGFLSAYEARRAAKTTGPVYLLRIPPSVGYQRSPINFYYCYDMEGSSRVLKRCLVEAGNTPWGESVTFAFNPSSDVVPKTEYISPFMDMLGNWRLKVNDPTDTLYAFVSVQHPKFGNYFSASFTANRVATSSSELNHELFFWLMPHQVTLMAYWNALKLWWKNVPFYDHPRKENPRYRQEGFLRNEKMQSCPAFNSHIFGANKKQDEENIDRCFVWKDMKWPWTWC